MTRGDEEDAGREPSRERLGRIAAVVALVVAAGAAISFVASAIDGSGGLIPRALTTALALRVALTAWRWDGRRPDAPTEAPLPGAHRKLSTFLWTLVAVELALRLVLGNYAVSDLRTTARAVWERDANDEYSLGSSEGCELLPGAQVVYTGWLLRIPGVLHVVNEAGYRGVPRPREKPEGTRRILLLGDSYTFGQGAPEDATIAVQLEEALGADGAGAVEVLNFGIEGLNLEDVIARYTEFASEWQHDMAIYLLSPNDLDGSACNTSDVITSIFRNVYIMRVPMMYALLIPIWLTPHEDVDERPRLVAALERFGSETRDREADLGIVLLANPMDESREWLEFVDVPLLDVSEIVTKSEYQIPLEAHLNREGGRLVASEIADWLRAMPGWASSPPSS